MVNGFYLLGISGLCNLYYGKIYGSQNLYILLLILYRPIQGSVVPDNATQKGHLHCTLHLDSGPSICVESEFVSFDEHLSGFQVFLELGGPNGKRQSVNEANLILPQGCGHLYYSVKNI